MHSFFLFPPKVLTEEDVRTLFKNNIIYKNLEMVIIDEVSMVRADLMNAIDISLRKNRNRANEAFGGVQMVFIGDMFQLPPVVAGNLNEYFKKYLMENIFLMRRYLLISTLNSRN
ncbi:MAG: AAA family ATPase [Ignavibacteria bacterium]|nr:AAA family ATPase [Ignavibacteria bacterium]